MQLLLDFRIRYVLPRKVTENRNAAIIRFWDQVCATQEVTESRNAVIIRFQDQVCAIHEVHSFRVKWVKCAKDFRKIEGQQIRQVVSLTERCIIEG